LEEQVKVGIADSMRFRSTLLISIMEAREYEKDQRRMTEVREALLLTQRPVLIETAVGPCASGATGEQCGDVNVRAPVVLLSST
jgi:hypothetical protein